MRAEELRIGNLVIDPISKKPFKWYRENYFDIDNVDFNPVQITEDLLLSAGFEKCPYPIMSGIDLEYSDYRKGGMVISPIKDKTIWEIEYTPLNDIERRTYIVTYQFVHQIQNLYFALKGTELEFKP